MRVDASSRVCRLLASPSTAGARVTWGVAVGATATARQRRGAVDASRLAPTHKVLHTSGRADRVAFYSFVVAHLGDGRLRARRSGPGGRRASRFGCVVGVASRPSSRRPGGPPFSFIPSTCTTYRALIIARSVARRAPARESARADSKLRMPRPRRPDRTPHDTLHGRGCGSRNLCPHTRSPLQIYSLAVPSPRARRKQVAVSRTHTWLRFMILKNSSSLM